MKKLKLIFYALQCFLNPVSYFDLQTFTVNPFCRYYTFAVNMNDHFIAKIAQLLYFLPSIGYSGL